MYIHIFKASRRRIEINQPPKPISCRVYRYFTPAASRLANAVSVSSNTFGVGMFVCLFFLIWYLLISISFGKSILYKIDYIYLLGSMFWTSRMSWSWFICWSKTNRKLIFLLRLLFFQVYKVRYKEDNQLYAIKRSLTKFRGKSDR